MRTEDHQFSKRSITNTPVWRKPILKHSYNRAQYLGNYIASNLGDMVTKHKLVLFHKLRRSTIMGCHYQILGITCACSKARSCRKQYFPKHNFDPSILRLPCIKRLNGRFSSFTVHCLSIVTIINAYTDTRMKNKHTKKKKCTFIVAG